MTTLPCYMSSTHMFHRNDWLQCVRDAKAMGFSGIELFGGERGIQLEDLSSERLDQITVAARELGLAVSVHPWVPWEELWEEDATAKFIRLLTHCADAGIQEVNMHLSFLSTRKRGIDPVLRITRHCLPVLEKCGIVLYYENVPDGGNCALGSELSDFRALFQTFASDTPVQLNIDTGHAHIMNQIAPLAQEFGDRWQYTHINDNDGRSDQHVAPGQGTADFKKIAALARACDYRGPLMMEYNQRGLAEGMAALTDAYAACGFDWLPVRTDAKPEQEAQLGTV